LQAWNRGISQDIACQGIVSQGIVRRSIIKENFSWSNIASRRAKRQKNLQDARQKLLKLYPGLKVEIYFARISGLKIIFENQA